MSILDVELYLQGKISTYKPLEINTDSDSVRSVLIMMDCPRRFYFDLNGFECDRHGVRVEKPIYLLINP